MESLYYQIIESGLHEDLVLSLVYQHRLAEAEVEARAWARASIAQTGSKSLATGGAVVDGLVPVLMEQARFEDARTLVTATLDIYAEIGVPTNSFRRIKASAALAESLAYQSRWDEAFESFEQIRLGVGASADEFERFVADRTLYSLTLLRAGRVDQALKRSEAALSKNEELLGKGHIVTAESRGAYAVALASAGDRARALEQFQVAVPILVSSAEIGSGFTTARLLRSRLILEAYIDTLADSYTLEDDADGRQELAETMFHMTDVVRAQRVQRALAASSARAATKEPELGELARREQDTQRRITALYRLLAENAGSIADQKDQRVIAELENRIAALERARGVLLEEIESRYPDYAGLVNPKPVTLADVRDALAADEVLLTTYTTESRTYVWAIGRTSNLAFAMADLSRDALAVTVRQLREALDPSADTLGDIPEFDLEIGYQLYATLLAPIEKVWKPSRDLLVVTHGPLAQLPLSVLPTAYVQLEANRLPLFSNYRQVPWLARTHSITMLPSVAALRTVRRTSSAERAPNPFVGFADPVFSVSEIGDGLRRSTTLRGSRGAALEIQGLAINRRTAPTTRAVDSAGLAELPRLPDTAEEVRSIATVLGANATADVYLRDRATENAVKNGDFSDRRVIAFATHGLVPGDLDGLTQPALAFSTPEVVGGGDDGLLTMGEIFGLDLNADLVVLSACNTAAADGAGAEAVSGLGRAFFYAGARSLLVSNWPVETTSTKALTTSIFERYTKNPSFTRADSVRDAMLGLIDEGGYRDESGRMLFSYAHPIFWGPFSLVGDGGGMWAQ